MSAPARLQTIDGLRGVAAFGVVLFHLDLAASLTFDHWVHPVVGWVFQQGFLGVDIFFVLSGFVIPFSVRNVELSPAFLGRFALRRSIRLDPPYWAAILLEVFLMWLGLRLTLAVVPLPSWPQFLSHFIYAQNILEYGDIVDVFWTLCFEIQFYLGLMLLFVLGHQVKRLVGGAAMRALAVIVFTALFVVSVLGRYEVLGIEIHGGFALIRWFQFFMGTCVYWLVSGTTSWKPLVGTWAFLLGVLVYAGASWMQTIPIATSALLWWSYRRDRMATILSSRWVQFLGAISYSLYLFHSIVGWRWIRLLGMIVGPGAPLPVVLAVFASGCAVAIGVSWAFWRFLEVPSMGFSKIVSLPRRTRSGFAAVAPTPASRTG